MASTSVLICLLALQGICLARAPPQDSPPTSTLQDLDKDLDRLMEDERLFNECYLCLIDMGPCTRDTSNFREVIQEALEHECARCTDTQRSDVIELLRTVMECRPREYAEIERQFDPSGKFKDKYKISLIAKRMAFPIRPEEEVEACAWA